jgi:hypothetical protein
MDRVRSGITVAREVDMTGSSSVILLANEVNGEVKTVLDTPQALLAGLVAGIGVGLVLFAGGLLRRSR